MAIPTEFVTPRQAGDFEIVIKKSRFIGHVVPILSIEEAESALLEIRTKHKTANHNCYAYTLGLDVPVERFSDDGEPSGTAGRPILEVLRRKPIANALVVVTRYFGGTLLGASGLVHAYKDATVAVLEITPLLTCRQMNQIDVTCDYGLYGKLEYEVAQLGHAMFDKIFEADVKFTSYVTVDKCDNYVKHLKSVTNGRANVVVHSTEFIAELPNGEFVLYDGPTR